MAVSCKEAEEKVTLVSIQVITYPEKKSFLVDELFDPSGLVVMGHYSDGIAKQIYNYTLSPVNMSVAGKKTITVTASGIETTFTVLVIDPAAPVVLESIQITVYPDKTDYVKGELFNPSGLVVMGHYSDGSAKQIYNYTLSPIDTSVAGVKTITVTASGEITTFTVLVIDPAPVVLESIQITVYPNKTNYVKGELFNPSGLVVMGHYSDGSAKQIYNYTLSPVDTSVAGVQTITVTASEKTATFTVLVVDPGVLDSIQITVDIGFDRKEVVIYGIPNGQEDNILIYWNKKSLNTPNVGGNAAKPHEITLSFSTDYTSVQWYVDNTRTYTYNNIITIKAEDYTLDIPHNITFIGVINGVRYSRTLTFTVLKQGDI